MADEEKVDRVRQELERKIDRQVRRERKMATRTKEKVDDSHLPTPPPDPWRNPWCQTQGGALGRSQPEMTQTRSLEEDEDILAYLTDLGTPFEGQTSECPSRNSTASTMAVSNLCLEESFDHLNRLYALTEQILELKYRSTKFFKRVRNLEKLKVLRNADRILEDAFARDAVPESDFCDEDTGFAESLLDAMLSNCRDPQFQRRNMRSPPSRRTRNKVDVEKQTFGDEVSKGGPKVSKWTRVKAAFKWERACTNDLVEDASTTMTTPMTPLSPTPKYLRIPDNDGNLTSTSASSCTDIIPDSTGFYDRTSSASLSNERSYDCSPKSASNHFEYPSSKAKEDKKEQCMSRRSQSLDGDMIAMDTERVNDMSRINEVSQETPLIRITSEKSQTVNSLDGMDEPEQTLKRPTPSLTITIPSNEEEMRCMSSPESYSPLPSSAHTSGGNSPQPKKIHRELFTSKGFKRQQSNDEEFMSLSSKMQRQDSKWNKVRRAFLTNSSLSVPPSPIRVFSRQMFDHQDGQEAHAAYSCSGSVDDLEQTANLNPQTDTRRDYRALKEKLGAEFHRKLVEWERLKNMSSRVSSKDTRETSSGSLNPRESLLSEERLAPEFRKKLQEWKRAKKERRGSAPFEQQRFTRRRLTDWQLWRSPSKTDYRNRDSPRGNYSSGESIGSGGRPHLSEDFVRKMEAWKRANEIGSRDVETSTRSNSNRLGIVSGIDESEFLALERLLSRFDNGLSKDRRESNARQLDECFDGDTRSYIDGAQGLKYANEVLVRTSVGSYRFEGISREFTQKLYDWERYRGISPRSSTFRLLGPAYDPFLTETNTEAPISTTTKIGCDEGESFKGSPLKRSKSAGSLTSGAILNEAFIRRSTSLQSLDYLANALKNSDSMNTSPISIDRQRADEATEDIVMDDSEPEAMIVDIEDVIEETASPLERVQPHQTPVYSVAASETTSIAVPLGTVTSSHEPSPVFLVEVEEASNRKQRKSKRLNRRNSCSSEDNPTTEHVQVRKIRNDHTNSFSQDDADSECWSTSGSLGRKKYSISDSFDYDRDLDKDSINSDSSLCSMELNQKSKLLVASTKMVDEEGADVEREEISTIIFDEGNAIDTTMDERKADGADESKTIHRGNLGNHYAFATSTKESTDLSSEKSNQEERQDERAAGDGSSDHEKDSVEPKKKHENEYEIINVVDPCCCLLADTNPATCSKKFTADTSTESSSSYKLDKNKCTSFETSSHRTTQENDIENGDKRYNSSRDKSYDRLYYNLSKTRKEPDYESFESPATKCSNDGQPNVCNAKAPNHPTPESVLPNSRQQYQTFGNTSSLKLGVKDLSTSDYHREPTIQTTSLTVAPNREERCVERIIVNEETLNKIVVPTASNSCSEKLEGQKSQSPTDVPASKNPTAQNDYRSSPSHDPPATDQETSPKKRSSPTRNVFIKTKRMIFSPFRRAEDHSASRPESSSSEHDQVYPLRNKSKSRSTSPKINRQDVLQRMSFSLPWPLRPSSKDRDLKEPKTDETINEERPGIENQVLQGRKSSENKRKSSSSESNVFQQSLAEEEEDQRLTSRVSGVGRAEEKGRFKYSLGRKEHRVSVSLEVDLEDQQSRVPSAVSSSSLKQDEKNDNALSSRFDPRSPDLMHKLEILSNVVARRDGRTNTISEESGLESHALRIRRAKEDFLSRRGGPLCHSVMEASSNEQGFRKTCGNLYEKILDDQLRDGKNYKLKLEEMESNGSETKEETMKDKDGEKSTSAGFNSTTSSMKCATNSSTESSSSYELRGRTKEEGVSLANENNVKELSRSLAVSLPDRVKSASAGMINVEPDIFEGLTDSNRGCESLPRTISNQQESKGPLTKIVNKFKFVRLICGKEQGNMSTVSRLCRQSLLIDVRNDFERRWEANNIADAPKLNNVDRASKEE
ncbi:uncharacterized protein LOC128896254 [Hylaeus anthracinus]|uniref:uncharacterized protein LOC128896254 n=1 Tax=Hylaeus anthracinus TaxID=313031 RepID=UPI0023BA0A6D|nr:uncharacterized protein LOC128896254 [Hylaeus anthracinus]